MSALRSSEESPPPTRDERLRHLAAELHTRMLRKGMTQADLCRATRLGRDSMSRYTRGMTLPDPLSLAAIAQALGCAPRDLDPGARDGAMAVPAPANGPPAFGILADPLRPGHVYVQLNRSLPFGVAARIMALLDEQQDAAKD